MANRVDDLITGFSDTKSRISGMHSPSIPFSDQETILNLTEDIRTRKNVILYSPPHHDRFFLSLEAVLPIASEFHKQIVIVLRNQKQIRTKILPQIHNFVQQLEDPQNLQPFLTLDLCQFSHSPIYRAQNAHKTSPRSNSPIPSNETNKKTTASLPISSMVQNFIRKFPVISGDMIPDLALTKNIDPIELLRTVSRVASVIVCTYEDVFAFNPLQPSIFKSLIDVEKSIIVYDDCHLLTDFVQQNFSFNLAINEIQELHNHLVGDMADKSNPVYSSRQFLKKYLTHFLRFLSELKTSSSKYHDVAEFRVYEFLNNLCDLHHCEMELLQSTFLTHMSNLFHSNILFSHPELQQTLVHIFNLFFLTFGIRKKAKIPYGFTIHFGSHTTLIETRLLDPRFYTDALFRQNFASISMSSAMDVRFYLVMLGLGNLQRGFIIRSLPSEPLENRVLVWGDVGVNPHHVINLGLVASKYSAKIVHHAHVMPYPTLVCVGTTDLFNTIIKQEIKERLQHLGREVIIIQNSDDLLAFQQKNIGNASRVPIVIVNLATISVDDIIPVLSYFLVVNFISFPMESDTLSLRKRTAYLTHHYDNQQAEMFRIYHAFSRINAICAQMPYNSQKAAILIFFDGLVLKYQRYLLPWAHQLITYAPTSSDTLSEQSALLLSSPHLS
ncbi:MAG: hypothetical protein ACTSRK_02445 [Promethearchaeota archaeon]